jgi:membrane protease YdiL (CAAX protease family)
MPAPRVEIVAASDSRPDEFRRLAQALRACLGQLALRIDHIGSTSVPGLAAKNVIDVQVTVAILDQDRLGPALERAGFRGWPDNPASDPGRRWMAWRPIVIAGLQAEFGIIVFQLVMGLVLLAVHLDLASIGNATLPAPGDWQPGLPEALLLLAVLPGVVEELIFRGVIFRTLRTSTPLVVAVAISSALFGLGHLSPDMAPVNVASVFLDTFVTGSLAALAYQRTGSLYAAILAHVFSNVGPALNVVLPHDMMQWVFLGTVELSVVGMLPFVFAVADRQRQRWALSQGNRP